MDLLDINQGVLRIAEQYPHQRVQAALAANGNRFFVAEDPLTTNSLLRRMRTLSLEELFWVYTTWPLCSRSSL